MANKNFKVNGLTAQVGSAKTEDANVRYILSANTETVVDTTSLTNLGSIVYEIDIEQGTKRRRSVVAVETDGTLVSSTEYGIVSVGDAISGLSIAVDANSGNARLKATITDASTTPAFFNILKKVYQKNLAPWGFGSASAENVGTSRAYNDGAASVTFTTVTGSPNANLYTAVSNPGGFTGSGSSSPLTVSGLQSGVSYTFDVTPLNAEGSGITSTTNSINATTVPQAPTIGTATKVSDTSASVTFTGNATGGSAITGYTVTSSPGNFSATGASSPLTVTGMTTNTYTFTAVATNANGNSAASAASVSLYVGPEPGAVWTTRTAYITNDIQKNGIAYGNGKFLTAQRLVSGTTYFRQSTDAITWSTVTSNTSFTNGNEYVAYNNGLFLSVDGGANAWTSTDGANWTSRGSVGSIASTLYRGIAGDGAGKYFLYGGSGSTYRISNDSGVTWSTPSTSGLSGAMIDIAYGNNLWIASTYNGPIFTSTDRITWTQRLNLGRSAIGYGNGVYFAYASSRSPSLLMTSTDAITWTTRTLPWSSGWNAPGNQITSIPGYFALYDWNGNIATSTDAVTWTSRTGGWSHPNYMNTIIGAQNKFVIGGHAGILKTSP